MKSLLEFILLRLVEHPEELEIVESEEAAYHVYTLHLHEDDIGRVIGRGGKVIKAIRKVAQVRAVIENIHIRIVLAEE